MPVVFGGDRVVEVSPELADAFEPGDRLIVVQSTGDLIHIPSDDWTTARDAVGRAHAAFAEMGSVADEQITAFFEHFAARLADDEVFAPVAEANGRDVAGASSRGRSTTRLVLSDSMRRDMVEGLTMWARTPSGRGEVVGLVEHEGWELRQVRAGLGVVGFVFEGRPNVFADAVGVLRSGNTVVFRIGSDALSTATAMVDSVLAPALAAAGLPPGAATLVASPSRAAGHAMFSDERLALAVARGSGEAVAQLGAVARQVGTPVSLHGTGGAWIVAGPGADPERLHAAVVHSLDRKVCNTLNTLCLTADRVPELLPVVLSALEEAGRRRDAPAKLHVLAGHEHLIPAGWFDDAPVVRASGVSVEPRCAVLDPGHLGHEWEWEASPEVSLVVVDSVDDAVEQFNEHSPQFVASLIDDDDGRQQRFFDMVNAPFVCDGFTRWVDGQYALRTPELGLSNWQFGRLFGRGGVLSGDSVFTVRTRVAQRDPELHR